MSLHVAIIANPVAGGGKARQAISTLEHSLKREGASVEIFLTEKSGDASAFAASLKENIQALAVVGGDGTLNEVINGIDLSRSLPLIQVPLGTANMLARELSLPFDPEQTASILLNGKTRLVDCGSIEQGSKLRRFLMVASAGFDSLVTEQVARSRSGTMGFLAYGRPILNVLKRYRPPELEISVDDQPPMRGSMIVAGKTKNYGGFFSVTNRAGLDSGSFDIALLRSGSYRSLLGLTLFALVKSVDRLKNVHTCKGKRITIRSLSGPVPVQIDGDYWSQTPVSIKILDEKIPLLIPQ